MQGQFCRFYVHENDRHHGQLLWEWLLEQANRLGIRGGSAFKAMAGFGSHHVLHEERFFELAGLAGRRGGIHRSPRKKRTSFWSCCGWSA